jgi:thioredoxin-related protein
MKSVRHANATFAVLCLLASAFPSPAAEDVEWRTDYAKARQEAQEKGRPLVIDCTTQDCYWCKQLEQRTFPDPEVAALLRERCVPLRLEADRHADLMEKLHVHSFPTLLFAGPDGKVLGYQEGFVEAPRLLEQLQKAVAAVATPVSRQTSGGDAAPRRRRARELLDQARDDSREGRFLCALDRCELLAAQYGDLPEAADASQLAVEIKSNPEWAKKTCDQLVDRLGSLYLGLAESLVRQGKPQQAVFYLELVIQTCPNSRHVEAAQARLSLIQGAPARAEDDKK